MQEIAKPHNLSTPVVYRQCNDNTVQTNKYRGRREWMQNTVNNAGMTICRNLLHRFIKIGYQSGGMGQVFKVYHYLSL